MSKRRQRENRTKREAFRKNVFPVVKKMMAKNFLDLECLDELCGHHRVMNDMGEFFDFWTTGTVMTTQGNYRKDGDTEKIIVEQIKILTN